MVKKTHSPGCGSVTRRRFLAGSSAAAGLLLSGIPLRSRSAAQLTVGVLLPRSGHLALIGQDCQRGADLALPILSDMGMGNIKLMSADTESNPDVGRTQAEKLIRDGANILVGCFDSGTTAAVAQVAEQKGIPFVINIAAAPQITEQGYQYVFRNFPTGPMLVKDGLLLMNQLFKATGTSPKTAVMMHVNDTFGTAMLKGVQALAPRVGLMTEIKEYIAYDPKAKDLSVEVAKAKAVKADIHMVVTRLNDAILMVREMVKQRYEPMGIITPGAPGMYESQFFKTLGKYSDYAVSNVPWSNPKQEMAQELAGAFKKRHPKLLFNLNAGFTFEAVLVAADAFRRAGSTNAKELAAALRSTDLEEHVMVGGPIQFNEKGQNVNIRSAALQNRDGLPRVVLPQASAEIAPVFPMPSWRSRG